jgi:hydrogenase maturation protease
MQKPVVVLGLGNPLMGDEGIGVRIIEILQSEAQSYPNAEFIDAGTGGLSILHMISGRQKAIIIDCALMGEEPGAVRRFSTDDVKTTKKLAHQSLHEADIIKVIEMSRQLGEGPDEVLFVGIEPESITERLSLSDTLENKIDEYADAVRKALE